MSESRDVDVVIVGAGISGVSAAAHLKRLTPDKSFAVLERRDDLGGTWDLFRYPGVRSDSDMQTLGFSFRPWRGGEAIADGADILQYVRDTARETGVDDAIRYRCVVEAADWSSADARWTVTTRRDGALERFTCKFLWACTGYYDYDAGHAPKFPGDETFRGPIVHPQRWPADLDVDGKRVVVIGSGATAISLVPALAETAAHVTMLQRSPTYLFPLARRDGFYAALRRVAPEGVAHWFARQRLVLMHYGSYKLSRAAPNLLARGLIDGVRKRLPADVDVGRHFTPSYDPWDQRICAVVDDDFFEAIKGGRASVVTDRIDRLTPNGILLKSGDRLDADVVVSATGLALKIFGGAAMRVDGVPTPMGRRLTYRGAMADGVPNFAFTIGYVNASWTLRADLVSRFVCRLLARMDRRGEAVVTPRCPTPTVTDEPFMRLTSGYVARAKDMMPAQGASAPWRHPNDYFADLAAFRFARLDDGWLTYERAPSAKT